MQTTQEETIFHKIVRGEIACHKVWEDEKHLAFLSIFPNTEGTTVVIPKTYAPSYFAHADHAVLAELMKAAQTVAKLLDEKLDDVGRTGLVFEGFGVNYLHAKLFPMHGTADMTQWAPIENPRRDYYKTYPGFISSHDAAEKSNEELEKVAEKILEERKS